MNLQEIEKLLDKYFAGDTSLAEEKKLRDFFASGKVPERWKDLEDYFSFIMQEQDQQIENPDFDRKIKAALHESKLNKLTDLRRPWIYWMAGVAATTLILIAVFVQFDPFSKQIKDTYNDPQVAFTEAKKILFFVSSKFNNGTSNLKPINSYENGLKELQPVASYNKAVHSIDRLNQVEKVEKLIINN